MSNGFSKNEQLSLSPKELIAFKELAKILISFSEEKMNKAIKNGDFMEVESI